MESQIVAPGSDSFNAAVDDRFQERTAQPTVEGIETEVRTLVDLVLRRLKSAATENFDCVEKSVVKAVFGLGRLFLQYFVASRHRHSRAEIDSYSRRGFRKRQDQSRELGTHFGKIRYWRTYMQRPSGKKGGVYPLDLALGLTRDGFSMSVLSQAAHLATQLSFDIVTEVMYSFLSWSPSKISLEKAVIGLGHYTEEWFKNSPAPEGDGSVLIIQIDSKATPTVDEEELNKRRGKRKRRRFPKSPRHRGRAKRKEREPKKRRKKGEKSKNGKAVTMVLMYTLRPHRSGDGQLRLLGPINRCIYASYGCKQHAFEIARREADKRGFTSDSGKLIQIVTDGERSFATNVKALFPEAEHTIDIYHVMEYVWKAAGALYKEGSDELIAWVAKQKKLLLQGKANEVIDYLRERLDRVPKTGPGNLGKRQRLTSTIGYLTPRVAMMNYDYAIAEDLEISSGAAEGAVKHVIAKRFDCGGMRWIRERAQALLQLRCISINGDWEAFIGYVRREIIVRAKASSDDAVLLTQTPADLPDSAKAA